MLEYLDPDTNQAKIPSLVPLAVRFPNIVQEAKLQMLDDEWRKKGRERSILHMDYIKVLLLNKAHPAVNQRGSIQPTELESTTMNHLRYQTVKTSVTVVVKNSNLRAQLSLITFIQKP